MMSKHWLTMHVSLSLVQSSNCPSGWYHHGLSCYMFSGSNTTNWFQAVKQCERFGGYSVKIDDGNEQSFITNKLKEIKQKQVCLLSEFQSQQ